jgi:type II secretory pathway component PulJ
MSRRTRAAFTLMEVLAVVLLTSIVIAAALNHYIDLSRASQRATDHTRGIRRATAVLDRVSRDLESAVLVAKPDDVDPLEFPWIFLGEEEHPGSGADRLRFIVRGHSRHPTAAPVSDLEVVAYSVRTGQNGDLELMRWSSPRLPDGLDRSIPSDENDGAVLLSDGLAEFGVEFVNDLGETHTSWDSSQLEQSGQLPVAVEIHVAVAEPNAAPDAEPERYMRRVLIPVRPLDMTELLDPVSLVSGGSGKKDETKEGDEEDHGQESAECKQTPCASLTACQAISCQAKLGHFGRSIDLLLEQTIRRNPSYCSWRGSVSRSVLGFLVDNPACR